MELDAVLQQGWARHAEDPAAVADSLEAALGAVDAPEPAARYLALVCHAVGDHLGDRTRAARLCDAVAARLGADADAGVHVRVAAARRLAGNETGAREAEAAAGDDPAVGIRVGLLVAQGHAHARAWPACAAAFDAAVDAADALPPGHAGERAVAIVGHDVASELLGLQKRDEAMQALMRRAAQASWTAWCRVGTWVNDERGAYLQSLVHRALGDAQGARSWADRGLATLARADGEEPVDEAFLHLARAAACRDAGDAAGHAADLAAADALAEGFPDEGLKAWFREERERSA
jgi:hypothetical protein